MYNTKQDMKYYISTKKSLASNRTVMYNKIIKIN